MAFSAAAGWLAFQRDRLVPIWMAYGALLGPVALVLLWLAPPGRCATCRSPVRGWLTVCEWCGMDVRHGTTPVAGAGRPAISFSTPSWLRSKAPVEPDRPLLTVTPTRRPTDPPPAEPPAPRSITPRPITSIAPVASPDPEPAPARSAAAPSTRTVASASAATAARPTPAGTPSKGRPATSASAATVITTGVYVTGTVGLAAGARYTIQVDGSAIQVVGLSDRSAKTVAFERPLEGLDATGLEGRLILSAAGSRGGTVLVFQSLDAGDPAGVARAIMAAVQGGGRMTA